MSDLDLDLDQEIDKALLLVQFDYNNERYLKPGDFETIKADLKALTLRHTEEKLAKCLEFVGDNRPSDELVVDRLENALAAVRAALRGEA